MLRHVTILPLRMGGINDALTDRDTAEEILR